MLEATSIQAQLAQAREDRLRVLVVGAGVAGVTVTQLLRRQGLHPVLVERSARQAGSGYMLALMPLVDPVLETLGVREAYLAGSVGLDRYRFRNPAGRTLGEYSLATLLDRFGDYRGISRGELLAALGSGGGAVTYGATVTALEQRPATVAATLDGPSGRAQADFDLVIAADGLHSATRGLVLGPGQVATYDSGWGGWVTWAEPDPDPDLSEELWGAGVFVGAYPVKGRLGVIVAGPRSDTEAGPERFAARVRGRPGPAGSRIARALEVVARHPDAYYWSLTDCRSDAWSVGRVVLLGDAAAGFPPDRRDRRRHGHGVGLGPCRPAGRCDAGRRPRRPPPLRAGPAAKGGGGPGQLPPAGPADVPAEPDAVGGAQHGGPVPPPPGGAAPHRRAAPAAAPPLADMEGEAMERLLGEEIAAVKTAVATD